MAFALLISVFIISTCGLVYELVSGALASYLLGDSVTQFSTVIGAYLFAMGVGSYLSRHISRNLVEKFIEVEIIVGLVGGFSAALLFMSFEHVASFRIMLYGAVGVIGALVGVELPLLMRILKEHYDFKELVSKVFTFDYIGALFASILFPLILIPHLGLVRTAFLFGVLNVVVALWAIYLFKGAIAHSAYLRGFAATALLLLVAGFGYSEKLVALAEAGNYRDSVIYAKTTAYQRIVLTKSADDLRLHLNGNLQFSSRDEYRYHEALVHVGLSSLKNPKRVLVLGGGDGLAVREILKYPSVESVTLVDLDKDMTALFSESEMLTGLNAGSLRSPRVRVVNDDAFIWLKDAKEKYDFIVVDFPDPVNFSVGKLYTETFYRMLREALAPEGVMSVQSTSPLVARKSFWCVVNTLEAAGFRAAPYHAYVPSFGEWGFIIASIRPFKTAGDYPSGLRFVSTDTAEKLFHFPEDMRVMVTDVNRLNNQILVRHFEEEWAAYGH